MLLLNINRKPYTTMGSPMALSLDLERSKSRSHRFRNLISHKGVQLGLILPLNINRKPYMGSPIIQLNFTLSDILRSNSRSLRFQSLISCKAAQLGPMLLLNVNTWLIGNHIHMYMGSPMVLLNLALSMLSNLERSKSRSLIFVMVADLYVIHIFASSLSCLLPV